MTSPNGELGVIPAVQGIFACSDGPWVEDRLGRNAPGTRLYLQYPRRSGRVPTNGTDPPVDEISPDRQLPLLGDRACPDGSLFQPQEVLLPRAALYSYTMGNAIAAFEEDLKGSITPGKLADITVLSKDLLTVPAADMLQTEIVMTVLGGRVRYRDGEIVR